jgi:hypothetical protein
MKKPIGLLFLVFLIAGCSKESFDSYESQATLKTTETVSLYVFDASQSQMGYVLQDVALNAPAKPMKSEFKGGVPYVHAHGRFHGFGGVYLEFKSTTRINGPGGAARLIQQLPFGEANMILETVCLSVDGNEAIYAGTFVSGFNPFPPGGPTPFDLGNTLYIKVVDNGAGQVDQYYNGLVIAIDPVLCEDLEALPWEEYGLSDVNEAADQIKVKTLIPE